jgi:YD repeat-containing protein
MRLRFWLFTFVLFGYVLASKGDLNTATFLEIAKTPVVNATPSLSGAKPFDVLNGDFSGAGLGQVSATTNSDIESPGGAVGTPPTNFDFSTGTLTGWTGAGSTVQSGGPGGSYGLVSSGTLVSSAFTIDSSADFLTLEVSTSGQYAYEISILYGPTYSSKSTRNFGCIGTCSSGWHTTELDAAGHRGESVKIEVKKTLYSNISVDDVGIGTSIAPGWFPSQGLQMTVGTGGPTGDYLQLSGTTNNVVSAPIAVDANAQNMSIDVQLVSGVAALEVLSGPTFGTATQLEAYSSVGGWSTKTYGITQYAGETIKLRMKTTVSTTVRWDNAGLFYNVIPGWTVSGDSPAVLGSASADNVYSSEFTLPAGNSQFRICGDFPAAFNGAGVPVGTQIYVWWGDLYLGGFGLGLGDPPAYKEEIFLVPNEVETTARFRFWLTSAATPVRPSVECVERLDGPCGPTMVAMEGEPVEDTCKDTSADSGDPVDVITGNYHHQNTDLSVPGKGVPLTFTRTYSAQALRGTSLGAPLGEKWTHNWQTTLDHLASGPVVIRLPGGTKLFFTKPGSTWVSKPGVEASLVENGGGDWTLTTKQQLQYNFSSAGKLTSVVDRNGYSTSLAYDGNGRLSTITDPGSRTLTLAYNGNDQIETVTDSLGRVVTYGYTGTDLTSVTDVNGGVTSYEYSGHLLTKGTDSNDHDFVRNTYDGFARVVSQLNAYGGQTTFEYSTPGDGATTLTDARGKETTYYFDTSYRITDIVDHDGNTTSFAWDSDNNRTCVTDPLGHKIGFTYDGAGNVTHVIDADNTDENCDLKSAGLQWTYTYTGMNDVDLATDPEDRETDYVYDGNGNLTQVARKDDSSVTKLLTCFTVPSSGSNKGLVTEIIESTNLSSCSGNTRLLEYDAYGNVTGVVDPRFSSAGSPPKAQMTYDLAGRTLTQTNENGHTTTYTYDARGMTLTVEDELSNTTTNTYDDKGLLLEVEDPNLNVTSYTYDAADRLISVEDAEGGVTTYTYDAVGNRTAVTDANRQPSSAAESGADCGANGTGDGVDDDSDGKADDGCPSTIYTYDNLNNLASEIDALGNIRSYDYDAASRLYTRTDARGLVTTYGYDNRNNLTAIDYPSGTPDVTYDYDAAGMRIQMIDGTGTTDYDYDALDRLTSVTFPGSRVVGYSYDNVGNRESITYPGGSDSVDYAYDEANNLVSVTDWNSHETTYDYDNAGMLQTATLPNGIISSYGYDNADRLTGITHMLGASTVRSVGYTLDNAGMRTQRVDGLGTHTYSYDNVYRLTGVTYPPVASEPSTTPPSFADKSGHGGSSGTSVTVPAPTELEDGDVLIALLYIEQNDEPITPPSGWTLKEMVENDHTTNPFRLYVYWKRADNEP